MLHLHHNEYVLTYVLAYGSKLDQLYQLLMLGKLNQLNRLALAMHMHLELALGLPLVKLLTILGYMGMDARRDGAY